MIQAKYFFGSDGMRALSRDLTGANLPPKFGPWHPFKITTLNGRDQDELDAIAAINAQGYFLFEKNADA